MCRPAVIIRINPADQQTWSTPYSCALAVVVFVVMVVASLRAQTATTGAIAMAFEYSLGFGLETS